LRIFLISIISLLFYYSVNFVSAQQGTTDNTNKVWDIAYLALLVSTILGVFVVILLLYFMNKYKEGAPTKRRILSHTAERNLEIVWIVLSVILVAFATGATLVYTGEIEATQTVEDVDATYYVEGLSSFRWAFFEVFPNRTRDESSLNTADLTLEINKKYELIITSTPTGIIHSFFVFDLGLKQDAIPGRETSIFFTPTTIGNFEIRCAQFCGSAHYTMAGQQFINVV
jgi:cytochrome c oxidase subunit 2